ncbi:Required for respiratory growth 9 mitochondrial [Fusarium albosuccineum]|uniref:Required for respiratory growth protein 9, mitochondrial n=1 Tax=Fusarium albosuccineum TaxID=1237068 RepID=A0A8H4LKY5_9HYPO|nr:Required for respiratory growth 9 mitochondrial [Fusarium albosuccineum]
MGCTCRATPLKIFVQGLSQVHKLEASPSLIRIRAPPARPTLYQNHLALLQQARTLHASTRRRQESTVAAASSTTDDAEPDSDTSPKNDAPAVNKESTEPDHPTEASSQSNPSPTPPRRNTGPRGKVVSLEDQPNVRVKRYTGDSKSSRAFQGVLIERPKGPAPGEPQSKESLWKSQRSALKEKFSEGWRPKKRLSPDALAGIRALNAQFPDVYTTAALAQKFEVSPEAIRRILKSKWQPTVEEEESRQERWFRRGKNVWEHKAALGIKPPQKWRREGVARDPSYHVWRQGAIKRNRESEEQDDREIRRGYTPRNGRGKP